MKKLLSILTIYALAISAFTAPMVAYGACVPPLTLQAPGGYPYMQSFDTGANNSCFIYILDKSGNLSISGNSTVLGNQSLTGPQSFVPQVQVLASSCSVTTPTSTYIDLETPSSVTLGQCLGTVQGPILATATATSGQYVILTATSATSTVTISSGGVSGVVFNATTGFILSANHTLSLVFDGIAQVWKAIDY